MRALAGLLLLLSAAPVSAAEALPGGVHSLEGNRTIDLSVTLLLGAGWIGSEAGKSHLAPSACRWCGSVPGIDETARDHWRWSHPEKADTLSNVADFVALPVLVLGADALLASEHGALKAAPEDALYIVESIVAASALNQAVKFSVGRERPFVHALPDGEKPLTAQPSDNNLSFYSGHTSLAFALVTSAGTVATLRGYKHAWLIWPVGIPAAMAIGYLRIGADKHWLTDVATGALLGTAAGVAIPLAFHGREKSTAVAASPVGGPHLMVSFLF